MSYINNYKELKCETYHIPTQHTLKQCPKNKMLSIDYVALRINISIISHLIHIKKK